MYNVNKFKVIYLVSFFFLTPALNSFCAKEVVIAVFLINALPTRGRLLEKGRLIEGGVYKIILKKRGAFIGEGRLKERGRLLEKIR